MTSLYKPGSEDQPSFRLNTAKNPSIQIEPLICFDVIDPFVFRLKSEKPADLFIQIANDASFNSKLESRFHFMLTYPLALYTRRPVLRLSNYGKSALILPSGQSVPIGSSLKDYEAVGESLEIPIYHSTMPRGLVIRLRRWVHGYFTRYH